MDNDHTMVAKTNIESKYLFLTQHAHLKFPVIKLPSRRIVISVIKLTPNTNFFQFLFVFLTFTPNVRPLICRGLGSDTTSYYDNLNKQNNLKHTSLIEIIFIVVFFVLNIQVFNKLILYYS